MARARMRRAASVQPARGFAVFEIRIRPGSAWSSTLSSIGEVISTSITASFNSPPVGHWQQDDSTDAGGGLLFGMGVR